MILHIVHSIIHLIVYLTKIFNCIIKNINFVKFLDEPVKSDGAFRLVSQSGLDVSPGERGLLLYKGGRVCDKRSSYYGEEYHSHAICRKMGYTRGLSLSYGYNDGDTISDKQKELDITLREVSCVNYDWEDCRSTNVSNGRSCGHILLTCSGNCNVSTATVELPSK